MSILWKIFKINVQDTIQTSWKTIKKAEKLIKNKGRLLVRPSGTEPKVRIMCESFDISLMKKCINIVKETIN